MVVLEQQSEYDVMKANANAGTISVSDVFGALRSKRITEQQCRELLQLLGAHHTPMWMRVLTA